MRKKFKRSNWAIKSSISRLFNAETSSQNERKNHVGEKDIKKEMLIAIIISTVIAYLITWTPAKSHEFWRVSVVDLISCFRSSRALWRTLTSDILVNRKKRG